MPISSLSKMFFVVLCISYFTYFMLQKSDWVSDFLTGMCLSELETQHPTALWWTLVPRKNVSSAPCSTHCSHTTALPLTRTTPSWNSLTTPQSLDLLLAVSKQLIEVRWQVWWHGVKRTLSPSTQTTPRKWLWIWEKRGELIRHCSSVGLRWRGWAASNSWASISLMNSPGH